MKKISALILAIGACVFVANSAQAAPIFSENFNAEAQGLSHPNFAQFNVTAGSVDVIGTGFHDYFPGHGNYVDLDGTMPGLNPAGQITTKTAFAAGDYTLSFLLGGSPTGNPNTVRVTFGNFSTDIVVATNMPLTLQLLNFTTTGGALSFTNLGVADNLGAILDDVSLSSVTVGVPEPLTLSLFSLGLAGATILRRRRAKLA